MGYNVSIKQYHSYPPVKYKNIDVAPIDHYKQFTGSPYAHMADKSSNEWISNIHPDIIFNHVYENNNNPYIIFDTFTKAKVLMLHIQFVMTRLVGIMPYYQFKKDKTHCIPVEDPYAPLLFGGNAMLGNIDFEAITQDQYPEMKNGLLMFQSWYEYMRRIYDPTHPLYQYFGALGAVPRNFTWHCFRYFYIYFDEAYHNWDLYPSPNDVSMYYYPYNTLYQSAVSKIASFPSPVPKIPITLTYMPFEQRSEAQAKQKKRGPKMLMYRVVKEVDL